MIHHRVYLRRRIGRSPSVLTFQWQRTSVQLPATTTTVGQKSVSMNDALPNGMCVHLVHLHAGNAQALITSAAAIQQKQLTKTMMMTMVYGYRPPSSRRVVVVVGVVGRLVSLHRIACLKNVGNLMGVLLGNGVT